LREMISRINQGGSQLGKKYFSLFTIAGEEEICERINVESLWLKTESAICGPFTIRSQL
jgi:hypothetical protein